MGHYVRNSGGETAHENVHDKLLVFWYNSLMAGADGPSWAQLHGEALLEAMLLDAVQKGISDIHVHPIKDGVKIRWRELGMLREIMTASRSELDAISRWLKFRAKLKLNLDTVPQDGQFTIDIHQNTVINIRVASLPTRFGEGYTLRILDPRRGIVPLQTLGFPPAMEQQLRSLMQHPNGLVLVTGPTGSGKTTTLYALLQTVTGGSRNIVTLEDPIEYELPDVTQSEIDPEHGYTFSTGLRAILRHDPDIILVGEIRDVETAETAVDAALTGHLVLATLHTNSAIEAIPRLLSMGIKPATFAPALRGILAQRLVRTVRASYREHLAESKQKPDFYDGRQVIAELLLSSPQLEETILNRMTTAELLQAARSNGFTPMYEHGKSLIDARITTPEEVMRVTEVA